MIHIILQHSYPISDDLVELQEQEAITMRNYSFNTIFYTSHKLNFQDFQYIKRLRSILAEGKSDYNGLKLIYDSDGKLGLIKEVG